MVTKQPHAKLYRHKSKMAAKIQNSPQNLLNSSISKILELSNMFSTMGKSFTSLNLLHVKKNIENINYLFHAESAWKLDGIAPLCYENLAWLDPPHEV